MRRLGWSSNLHMIIARDRQKKRRSGGKVLRQKSWRWTVEVDNMLIMTPFAAGGLRRFQVPEDWEQKQGNDCLAGHVCSCLPPKSQIRTSCLPTSCRKHWSREGLVWNQRIASDSFEHIAWSQYLESESFHQNGQKVRMCRWFQVFLSL